MAQCWLYLGRYYAALNPELLQIPQEEGLVEWFESGIAEHVRDADADVYRLVAEANGQVVGNLGASVAKPWEDDHREVMRELSHTRLTIYVLAVAEAYRHQGIGTRLMEVAEEWARGRGATLATTDTYVGSHLSVPFYRNRMGYNIQSLMFRKRL
ncbi:MAG: GNAT family N-acetyltransferase [Chloroflexota bacterium]|nr:GNAT family N-acetyltransferase [Chloroflexota bacterium]